MSRNAVSLLALYHANQSIRFGNHSNDQYGRQALDRSQPFSHCAVKKGSDKVFIVQGERKKQHGTCPAGAGAETDRSVLESWLTAFDRSQRNFLALLAVDDDDPAA